MRAYAGAAVAGRASLRLGALVRIPPAPESIVISPGYSSTPSIITIARTAILRLNSASRTILPMTLTTAPPLAQDANYSP